MKKTAGTLKTTQKDKISTVASLELALDLIEEDPNQPRNEFDPVTLQELADTIRLRGVKTPISVHPNLQKDGYFIINHGARRFRASILAGKESIPAFIDSDYTQSDQLIENLQRDNLTPREIADFIGRQVSKGLKSVEVANEIGKSEAFVSQHLNLLNLPDPIAKLFNSGEIRDVIVINDLLRAYKQDQARLTKWLNNPDQEITRSSIRLFREFIKNKDTHYQESNDITHEDVTAVSVNSNPVTKSIPPMATMVKLIDEFWIKH
jgi:ParB/RepB/Spo0J family partition protein